MANKTITRYGDTGEDFKIEETRTEKLVSTVNIKVLEKEIATLKAEIEKKEIVLIGKEELLEKLKKIK